MVISSRNPVHSVFYLVVAFVNSSLLLIIMGVEFLSILFIIVYVGAIAILFLFVVMMLNIKFVELLDNTTRYVPIGFIIGLIFLSLILANIIDFNAYMSIFSSATHLTTIDNNLPLFLDKLNYLNIESIGNILYTDYFLFFIIASFILLVSMIGAIILTIYHEENIKRQDLFSQISTEFNKTVSF